MHFRKLARGGRRTVFASLAAFAAIAGGTALAAGDGSPIIGGVRNPSSNPSLSFTGETQIIADNSTFGTRQSNKGTGGGAIYGCRAATSGPGCIVADNIVKGLAFQFISGGSTGGQITLADTKGAPFTTNATGVATGLNANYLQGHQATDFAVAAGATGATGATGVTGAAANSVALGGVPASGYEQTSQLLFAAVDASGALGNNRGAASASNPSAGSYKVAFDINISKCSFTASPMGASISGALGVALDPGATNTVDVSTPAPVAFQLQVIC
jgi:hypothetical protein